MNITNELVILLYDSVIPGKREEQKGSQHVSYCGFHDTAPERPYCKYKWFLIYIIVRRVCLCLLYFALDRLVTE